MRKYINKITIKITILLIVLIFVNLFVFDVKAADLLHAQDSLSAQTINDLANHTIQFTTPSGVNVGQTISLTFDSHFDTSGVDFTDVDLLDDGVDINLALTASGSTWGALFLSDVLTFTAGTNTISPGSIVTIQIGTHATHQVVGDQQIVNPDTNGSYLLNINGSFGDEVGIGIFVSDDIRIGISGTVELDDDPGPSVIPLYISNVDVINITTTAGEIIWQTNREANSMVEYGLTTAYEIGLISDTANVTSHSILLTDLTPGTTYHFRVRSVAPDGVSASMEDFTFTTLEIDETKLFLRAIPEKRLPAIGNNSTYLQVKMYQSGTTNLLVDDVTLTDQDGYSGDEISLEEITLPAVFDFLIKGYSHLQRRINNITVNSGGELVDLSFGGTVFEKAGDVNGATGDNYVNGVDLSVLANHIYTDDYKSDLNQDKLVNGLEFAITVTNLFLWGDF